MTSFITINNDGQMPEYDWNKITNPEHRQYVKQKTEQYEQDNAERRAEVLNTVATDTLQKAEMVADFKQRLPHGEFRDFCKERLRLNKDTMASLNSVHQRVLAGGTAEDVLDLASQMECRAAAQLLKADEGTQKKMVSSYQSTGRTPSRRDFEYAERARSNNAHKQSYNAQLENAFEPIKAAEPVKPASQQTIDTESLSGDMSGSLDSTSVAAPASESDEVYNYIRDYVFSTYKTWNDADIQNLQNAVQLVTQFSRSRITV